MASGNHIPYPSTPNWTNFKRDYITALNYDPMRPRQCTFVGTVKLHGTNATIVFRNQDTRHPQIQARTWIIEDNARDNLGTRKFLSATPLHALVAEILRVRNAGSRFSEILIAGEMAGRGVQKGVAIAEMQPFFAIFNIRIDDKWVDIREYKSVALPEHRIFNLAQYETFEVQVDFTKDTTAVSKQMDEYTAIVCDKCPFGANFVAADGKKIAGKGEGIVWTMVRPASKSEDVFDDTDLWNFKTKGEAFSTTKPRPPRNKEPQEAAPPGAVVQFTDYALGERRFEQGLEFLLQLQAQKGDRTMGSYDLKQTGAFIQWVTDDAIKEEKNEMEAMGVSEKEARRGISTRARLWYMEKCKEEADKQTATVANDFMELKLK